MIPSGLSVCFKLNAPVRLTDEMLPEVEAVTINTRTSNERPTWHHWLAKQLHTGFRWHHVVLGSVALGASQYQIRPRRLSSTAPWHDVAIDSSLLWACDRSSDNSIVSGKMFLRDSLG
jgi:hypothetical protein